MDKIYFNAYFYFRKNKNNKSDIKFQNKMIFEEFKSVGGSVLDLEEQSLHTTHLREELKTRSGLILPIKLKSRRPKRQKYQPGRSREWSGGWVH